jgi:hypothetical protein
MKDKLSLVSYTLAAIAGICFVSGIVIITGEGRV